MNAKPRALLMCDRLDVAGGVERFVCVLANHLAGEGWDVALGTAGTAREDIRYSLEPGVRVLGGRAADGADVNAAPRTRWGRLWALARQQWRIGRRLAALIRSERADVVLLNGLTTTCSTLAWCSRTETARIVCCDHNHFTARSALWQRLRARWYPRVAAVVSLTQVDAPRFAALNPVTRVIFNASALRAEVPARPGLPIVLAVGRHVAQKGFDLLLQAWAQVVAQRPDAQLQVIGEGPLQATHAALADKLKLAGQVSFLAPRAEMAEAYREAAVFVLPSRYEGMPLVLLEAQALGVPAVAFDCPTGPADVLTPETGRLVPAGDVAALAQALVELLDDPLLRARMAEAAIERSRRVFSPERHLRAWTTLLGAVASRTPVPEVLA